MNKTGLLVAVVTLVIIVGGLFVFTKNKQQETSQPETLPANYEYFWGEGCPHCENVAKFLEGWEGRDKVTIEKMEVFKDQTNALAMQKRAQYCKLTPPLGVPLLFTPEGTCFVGDEPIIEHFEGLDFES